MEPRKKKWPTLLGCFCSAPWHPIPVEIILAIHQILIFGQSQCGHKGAGGIRPEICERVRVKFISNVNAEMGLEASLCFWKDTHQRRSHFSNFSMSSTHSPHGGLVFRHLFTNARSLDALT
jgi:hypothetical protein